MDPKPSWSWKMILVNLVIVAVVFNIGYTLAIRQGQPKLIMDATLKMLGETNVVPRRIVDQ